MRAGPWAGSSGTWGEEGKAGSGEKEGPFSLLGDTGPYWARAFIGKAESTTGPKVWAQGPHSASHGFQKLCYNIVCLAMFQ